MAREPHLRDYLTRDEVAQLLRAAKKSPRHAVRNHAMILIAYRHGLRASELTNLRVSDVDLRNATIYCRRAKGSRQGVHQFGDRKRLFTACRRISSVAARKEEVVVRSTCP